MDNDARNHSKFLILCSRGEVDKIRLYLERNAGDSVTKYKDAKGKTGLFLAVENGNLEAVKIITQRGQDQIAESFNQACQDGNLGIVECLFGINPDLISNYASGNNLRPIHFSAMKNQTAVADFLIRNGAEINATTSDKGNSALMIALQKGFKETAQLILNNCPKVDVTIANNEGATALHFAAQQAGFYDIIDTLARRGAHINSKAINGLTPLHCASKKNNFQNVEILLVKGANISLINKAGKNAQDLAKSEDIKDLLSSQKTPFGVTQAYLVSQLVSTNQAAKSQEK